MRRRSFQLSQEIFWKLENIQSFQNHDNISESVRFCIDYAYEALCLEASGNQSEQLSELIEKNNLVLRFILIELVKMHEGKVQPLNDNSKEYLKALKKQMQDYLEKR